MHSKRQISGTHDKTQEIGKTEVMTEPNVCACMEREREGKFTVQ